MSILNAVWSAVSGNSTAQATLSLGATALVPIVAQRAASGLSEFLKNGVGELTESLLERALRGELKRAYGRDGLIDRVADTISATSGATSVILVGVSGVGKTSVIHELASRIVEGRYRKLKDCQLLSLKLRKTQGQGGAQATFKSWWEGGAKARVTEVLEFIKQQRDKKFILFIDEFQDLLEVDPSIFDSFRNELAENLTIIAATMNQESAKKLLAREGFARRFNEVKVTSMSPDDAIKVVGCKQTEFYEYYKKEYEFEFTFEKGVATKVVELSGQVFPGFQLPEGAIKFLDQLCSHLFNNSGTSKGKSISEKDVSTYATTRQGKTQQETNPGIVKKEDPLTIKEHIKRNCFTPLVREETKVNRILEEFPGLQNKLNAQKNPFLILQSESLAYLLTILSQWQKNEGPAKNEPVAIEYTVYRCNVKKLLESLDFPEKAKCLEEVLNDLFSDDKLLFCRPLLILEDFPAYRLQLGFSAAPYPQIPQPPISFPISAASSPPIQQTLDGLLKVVDSALGGRIPGLVPTAAAAVAEPISSPPKQEQTPAIFQQLLTFIEEKNISCAALVRAESTKMYERKQWTTHFVENPSLQDTIAWLKEKYSSKGIQEAQIATVLFALYYLKNRLKISSVLDIAIQIIDRKAEEPEVPLERIFTLVLSNYVQLEMRWFHEVHDALTWSGNMQGLSPFLEPLVSQNIGESRGLNTELHYLTINGQTSRILWVQEESQTRKAWAISLIGAYMKDKHKCFLLNSKFFEKMPLELEEFILREHLVGIDSTTIIIVDEKDLNHPQRRDWLVIKGCKIICFKQPSAPPPAAEISHLQNTLRRGLESVIGSSLTLPIPTPVSPPPMQDHWNGYTCRELDIQTRDPSSLSQVLSYVVTSSNPDAQPDSKGVSGLIIKIQKLYPLLINPSLPNKGHSVDDVCSYIKRDLNHLNKDGIESYFAKTYGEELGMSYYDVLLLTDPEKVPYLYRFRRVMTGTAQVIYETLSYPFKAFPRVATTLTSIAVPFIFPRVARFLFRRRA